MPHPSQLRIANYTYELPDDSIARYPLADRAASKLLVYKDGAITEDVYANIAAQVPAGMLMVFNQTKVVHARLLFKKNTGSTIEVFCLEPDARYADVPTAMLQKGQVYWQCLVGGAAKWKPGMVLELHHQEPDFTLKTSIAEKTAAGFTLLLEWDADMSFAEVLHHAGHVPLPPYLHRAAEADDSHRYQTVYARQEGSVAAPTAGLHFTPAILQSLMDKGIDTGFVTLHVGAGTFKPVKSDTMHEHEMHAEWLHVSQALVGNLIAHLDTGIVAVGTTSLRTLESLYRLGNKLLQGTDIDWKGISITQWDAYEETEQDIAPKAALEALLQYLQSQHIDTLTTRTQILIAPGYGFKIVKGLVTNFHQPQSTLLLLVAALIGDDWRRVYDHALAHGYRFLSYGDGSLLWRP